MKKAIVKVDLVGSTQFFSRIVAGEPWTMNRVHETLNQTVRAVFPDASLSAPTGSFVTSEGDAVILALDKPTIALRCAIELQRKWAGVLKDIPDIRIVIDYGDVSESKDATEQVRLLGEPFTVTARMEKQFGAGEIGITEHVRRNVDATLVFFRRGPQVQNVPTGAISTWKVIYDNPRALTETALAHALFVAEPDSDKVRERALEALIADCLLELVGSKSLSIAEISTRLRNKGLPGLPARDTVAEIVGRSNFLEVHDDTIVMTDLGQELLRKQRGKLDEEKQSAVELVTRILAEKLSLPSDGAFLRPQISNAIEEFLCAVFLEVRMMANYFRSTGQMFDRLAETAEFDFVINDNFPDLSGRPEQFAHFKRVFLGALRALAESNNVYIAAIFHNVLLLYYLNRHDQTAVGALAKIKSKKVFFDTNALYAMQIPAMLFHGQVAYAADRLRALGAEICVYDISVDEYNQSLDTALSQFKSGKLAFGAAKDSSPFIWKEYARNPGRYMNRFETCIDVHRIPRRGGRKDAVREEQKEDLRSQGISLEILPKKLSREELGDLYSFVHTEKDAKERAPERLFHLGIDYFGERVLHDANCLYWLSKQPSCRPMEAKNLFVTCDFYLARVRKRAQGQYDFVMTAPEFYEFMLPYLFLNDESARNPIQWPNSIFAMLVENEDNRTTLLSGIFRDYLTGRADPKHYEVLAETSVQYRFEEVTRKHESIVNASDKTSAMEEYLLAATSAYSSYEQQVTLETRKILEKGELGAMRSELAKAQQRESELLAENEKLKAKIRTREKFVRRSKEKKP